MQVPKLFWDTYGKWTNTTLTDLLVYTGRDDLSGGSGGGLWAQHAGCLLVSGHSRSLHACVLLTCSVVQLLLRVALTVYGCNACCHWQTKHTYSPFTMYRLLWKSSAVYVPLPYIHAPFSTAYHPLQMMKNQS